MQKVGDGDWSYVPGCEKEIAITADDIYEGTDREVGFGEWKFENLPKYSSGHEIQYKVVEDPVLPSGVWAVMGGEKGTDGKYNLRNAYINHGSA